MPEQPIPPATDNFHQAASLLLASDTPQDPPPPEPDTMPETGSDAPAAAIQALHQELAHIRDLQQELLSRQQILDDSLCEFQKTAAILAESQESVAALRTTLQKTCHHLEHTTRNYYTVMENIPRAADAAYTKVLAKHQHAYAGMVSAVGKYMADATGSSGKTSLFPHLIILAVLLLALGFVYTTLSGRIAETQSILQQEQAFWYNEENHQLYLKSRTPEN